jgi:hypothetical protein
MEDNKGKSVCSLLDCIRDILSELYAESFQLKEILQCDNINDNTYITDIMPQGDKNN